MSLPVLRRIAALAEAGATIVGKPPSASPSQADRTDEFLALSKRLWSGAPVTTVGTGRVVSSDSVEEALRQQGVAADFLTPAETAANILFVHRRLADGDLYFLTNRQAASVRTEARFRVSGLAPEIWRADRGTREPVSYRIEGSETVVPLDMSPDDAFFVVFRKPASQLAATVSAAVWRPLATIEGPWNVAFQPGRGAPASAVFPALSSWAESADPGLRYFSGVGVYTKSFRLPPSARPDAPLVLDLGAVREVAEVRVNGRLAGTAWKAPYRVDIGGLVRAGVNTLEVRVVNLWVNRLIGDAQPGATRVAFTTLPTYRADAPLRPSGLLGPVVLLGR